LCEFLTFVLLQADNLIVSLKGVALPPSLTHLYLASSQLTRRVVAAQS
jgi:hypothetical protein